jgi:hypothetical protein
MDLPLETISSSVHSRHQELKIYKNMELMKARGRYITMTTNMVGSLTAIVYFGSCILLFVFRLLKKPVFEQWIGIFQILMIVPLIYLLLRASTDHRPVLYYIQVGLMLMFIVVETFLDIILKVDFRTVRWSVISYVVFFFAATGGMVGVAANAGIGWKISAVTLFLLMAGLAFLQRAVTGL